MKKPVEYLKNVVKHVLRKSNYELRPIAKRSYPPQLYYDPSEVIRMRNSHELAALSCPIDDCISFNGLEFSDRGWHPFTQAAKLYLENGIREYKGTSLEAYYAKWQPRNARDALVGAKFGPLKLNSQPSYIKHLPWSQRSIEERAAYMARVIEIENVEFGGEKLTIEDGYGLHGPVSIEKGRLEYHRIIDVVDSIRNWGYDRWRGDIVVEVLKRDGQCCYLVTHGHHRVAAMAVLGHKYIPAIPDVLIEDRYVSHWPSVYKGEWNREEALAYFNHLFDFNSLAWAKKYDFL